MACKQLQSMDKVQILNIMREQEIEIEKLTAELNDLREKESDIKRLTAERDELAKKINECQPTLENAFSLTEASVSLNSIMQSAQETTNRYLDNIRALEDEKNSILSQAEDEAKLRAAAIIKEAELRREKIEATEKSKVDELKRTSQMYMKLINTVHSALHDMMERYTVLKDE